MQKLMQEEANRVEGVLRDARETALVLARLPQGTRELSSLASQLEDAGFEAAAVEVEELAQSEQLYKESLRASAARYGGFSGYSSGAAGGGGGFRPALGISYLSAGGGAAASSPPDATEVKAHMRAAAGALRATPESLGVLPSLTSDAASRVADFANGPLLQLVGVARARLMTTKAQAEETSVEIGNKQARIDAAERELALLREELRKTRLAHATARAEMELSLARARDEEASLARAAEEDMRQVRGAAAARVGAVEAAHAKTEEALRAEVEKLGGDLKTATEGHLEQEAVARKRKERARVEVEAAIKEYDAAMLAAQAQLDALKAQVAVLDAPLAEFREYYGDVEGELRRLSEEERAEFRHKRMLAFKALREMFIAWRAKYRIKRWWLKKLEVKADKAKADKGKKKK